MFLISQSLVEKSSLPVSHPSYCIYSMPPMTAFLYTKVLQSPNSVGLNAFHHCGHQPWWPRTPYQLKMMSFQNTAARYFLKIRSLCKVSHLQLSSDSDLWKESWLKARKHFRQTGATQMQESRNRSTVAKKEKEILHQGSWAFLP